MLCKTILNLVFFIKTMIILKKTNRVYKKGDIVKLKSISCLRTLYQNIFNLFDYGPPGDYLYLKDIQIECVIEYGLFDTYKLVLKDKIPSFKHAYQVRVNNESGLYIIYDFEIEGFDIDL